MVLHYPDYYFNQNSRTACPVNLRKLDIVSSCQVLDIVFFPLLHSIRKNAMIIVDSLDKHVLKTYSVPGDRLNAGTTKKSSQSRK